MKSQTEHEKRLATERKIVRHMIRTLKAAGWSPCRVDDGGDEDISTRNETEMMEAIFSVDESRAKFKGAFPTDTRIHTVLIVLGNDLDVIADHSLSDHDTFGATMDKVSDYVNNLENQKV